MTVLILRDAAHYGPCAALLYWPGRSFVSNLIDGMRLRAPPMAARMMSRPSKPPLQKRLKIKSARMH